ncbi:MAG: type VI secretion system-associated protein TagF [Alteromonadaceae bacterium]|nr:type VI secretion system-associated protein TagF [Alteromonadaceae bacterium]
MKIGFFGKLPGYGDFIQRNVSPQLINYWDNWILQSIESSRTQLRDNWQVRYFNSPIWRFVIGNDILSETTITGFMMPSVDKSGRCYPFTVICQADYPVNPFVFARNMDSMHEQAEDFVLGLLEKNSPNLDDINRILNEMYCSAKESFSVGASSVTPSSAMEIGSIADQDVTDFSTCNESFLDSLLKMKQVKTTIWWMSGGVGFIPQKRYFSGMPPTECYQSFLVGADA